MAHRPILSAASTFALAGIFAFAPADMNSTTLSCGVPPIMIVPSTSDRGEYAPTRTPKSSLAEESPCHSDLNHDGYVDLGDYLLLIELASPHPDWAADLLYTFDELLDMISVWGPC